MLGSCLCLAGCERDTPIDTPNGEQGSADPALRLPEDLRAHHPVLSPNAQVETHIALLAERDVPPHPGDGGGRAWLTAVQSIGPAPSTDSTDAARDSNATTWRHNAATNEPPSLVAGSRHRIEITFEVGPLGIEQGGILFVEPEPFWGWSPGQAREPMASGYVTANAIDGDVELIPSEIGASFEVVGRDLRAGEQVAIVVGAGPTGAEVDRFAGHDSEILIGVDADGDGFRRWLPDSVSVTIEARPAVAIIAFGPADVSPGSPLEIQVAPVDELGNRAEWPPSPHTPETPDARSTPEEPLRLPFEIDILESSTATLANFERSAITSALPRTSARIALPAPTSPGTLRLRVRGSGRLAAFATEVNPIVIREASQRLVWGDLHGHTGLSDGTGTPDDYFAYARDVARLDFVALTDHDHWGIRPLDESAAQRDDSLRTGLRYHVPGRFVTIPGFEWTSWLHGHRHVLFFDGEPRVVSSIDPETDRPDELWAALRGEPVLTFAHHSAGDPVATNWFYPPDPVLEPLTEISSVHGSSEAADSPRPVQGAVPGYFVRDQLIRGLRFGFIGSGDSHDGHPGLAHIASGQAGLAGVFAATLDRPGLLAAMRARHTFATNGIRPFLEVSIDGVAMGGSLDGGDSEAEHVLRIRYEGTGPVERADLIRSGRIASVPGEEGPSFELERRIPRLGPGEFHYVRIIQTDGGVAWSSPIHVSP